ncbi:N-acetylglucosamine-6-phosphate deacetylase [Limnochorda pilosa]|uniref:N-acetylglucosamine-6-phosphate deacetylase n=1 Tax=Limnochorda pilosa TaxID=1555112 RepID=UPI0026EA66DC|nr:N-acetylglucosamine-6-phosphate deacetylase [Limnochorda pilosa]
MSEATAWLLRGARIHQGTQWADEAVLAAVGGRIAYVGDLRKLPRRLEGAGVEVGRQSLEEIHTEGGYLCPGFIDVHLHGGGGADVMDASPGALSQLARTHARHGTVAFLPTTVTAPYEQLHRVLEAVEETAGAREEGAELLGVHLEGPHLNPARAGAQNPEFLTPPSLPEMQALLERFPGRVRWVTVAPELEGARELIQYLREAGVVVSIGHSDATYEQAMVAFQWGISHATHTFNGMNPLHHRAPGVPGAVLTAPGVSAEIIADGFHIHPGVARLLWQVKGPDRLLLVTDAMRATDLPDGRYDLGGLEVDVVGGAARLAGQETLAGSTLTLERAVAWMVEAVGLSLAEAVQLASLNPARRLGVAHRLGSLEVGKDASLVLLDDALRVRLTLRQGELMYDGQGDEFEDAAHGGAGALDGEPSEMLDHEEAY